MSLMTKRSLILCLITFIVNIYSLTSFANQFTKNKLDLSGIWEFQTAELKPASPEAYAGNLNTTSTERWEKINVPSNWYLQGKDIHGKAWYRKSFTIKTKDSGSYFRLIFQGVDYTANVWLNGKYLGHHEGYFQPFDFDVSSSIHKGENLLMVLVDSPIEESKAWSLNKRLIKGIFSHHDTRPGGAWSVRGQEKNTGGIWAPVSLKISSRLAIKQLEVIPNKEVSHWNVNSTLSIGSKLPNNSQVTVEGTIEPVNFTGSKVQFKQTKIISNGTSQVSFKTAIIQPKLWWPVGHGAPNLYRIKIKLTHGKRLLDQEEAIFGFREIFVDTKTQEWHINGRRMFIRGTNYISSQWLSEMTTARYLYDINLMKNSNINAVRVHAHIEAREFYNLCDQNGLLVFQDFPLQWGYSDDPIFIEEARKQVSDMVHSLNNHPSIVDWTLHNEPPWDANWMKYKYTDYDPNQNRTLDDLLYRDVSQIESNRYIRKQSATFEHAWMGWYFGDWKDFKKTTNEAWISEFGAQALPSFSSLRKIFSDDELWPDNDKKWEKWSYHNFQKHETFDIAKVQQGKNTKEFIQNTQEYQSKLIKFAAESYRRQRYSPVTGIFQFMFVEDWPSINWGIVDYWRVPKPAYDSLALAYQPVLPSIEWDNDIFTAGETATFGLWVINDLWQSFLGANYQVRLLNEGSVLESKSFTIDILEDSGKKIDAFKTSLIAEGSYMLEVKIISQDGALLGQNTLNFTVKSRP